MTSPYILENTIATKSSTGRSFIYVLSLNIKDSKARKPFFVSSTKNIAKRMARHQQSDWHYKTFGRPVYVTIIGSVEDSKVTAAEVELKQLMIAGGCVIMATDMTIEKANVYFNLNKPIFYDIDKWAEKFHARTLQQELNPVKNMDEVSKVTLEGIVSYLDTQCGDLSTENLNFAKRIAESFNPQTGSSKIVFEEINSKNAAGDVNKKINKVRHIWNPQEKLKAYNINEFRLTKPVVKWINTNRFLEERG